jgi:hypothetical protein
MYNFNVIKYNKLIDDDNVINYVIYSHSSFTDILQIQLDYLKNKGKLTLFINENDSNLEEIYKQVDNVIFYQNNLTYPQKVAMCLRQIKLDYFIFIHDNDIVYDTDDNVIKNFFTFLRSNNYDRIDFQLAYDFDELKSNTITDNELYYIKSSNTDTRNKGYIYNVNPSIWKKDTLLNIMSTFEYLDYRTIEDDSVQNFSLQYNIFKLFSKERYHCGYFKCLSPFKYLHITHSGHILSLQELTKESYKDIENIYNDIVTKYNLKNSNKWVWIS